MRVPTESQLGPLQVHQLAVDDVEHRSPRAIVVDRIGVEGGYRVRALGQLVCGQGAGPATVNPAVEGGDHDGGVELGFVVDVVKGHATQA